MIELMKGMPEGTLGVPELHRVVQTGGRLRTLYLIDRLEEMDAGALWEDAKTGLDLGIRNHSSWERTAVVSDQEWLARAAGLFAWMAPGELRIFPVAELEQAKSWVAGA